ncbi:hypothetical protein FBU30_007613 [Linnemannia zychae]|nr:hypothetical protein FBU30_007613 [Linnemannia zychae]
MAIATFTGMAIAAAPDNTDTIDYSSYGLTGPIYEIYAYWPDKAETDPNTRVIELTLPHGRTFPYRLHYKDPKNNKYDLSNPQDAEEDLANSKSDNEAMMGLSGEEHEAASLDAKVAFSVMLDKDDKIVYVILGSTVPTSARDVLNHQEAYVRYLRKKLDPNTPDIDELNDPGSIAAQMILNDIALKGVTALEDAKNDPNMIRLLDGLYDSTEEYFNSIAELEARATQEETEAKSNNVEKRHIKQNHHHHQKSSNKKNN